MAERRTGGSSGIIRTAGPGGARVLALGLVLVAATSGPGCSCSQTEAPTKPPATSARPIAAAARATIAGEVRGPLAGILSDHGAAILGNNGASLIGNHAASWRLLALAERTQAVAGATVRATSLKGVALPGETVKTDAAGRFSLAVTAGAGKGVLVRAEYQLEGLPVTLAAAAPFPAAGGRADVKLDPATSLVAKKLEAVAGAGGVDDGAAGLADLAPFAARLGAAMDDAAIAAAALQLPSQAGATLDGLLARNAEVAGAIAASAGSWGQAVRASTPPVPAASAAARPGSAASAGPTAGASPTAPAAIQAAPLDVTDVYAEGAAGPYPRSGTGLYVEGDRLVIVGTGFVKRGRLRVEMGLDSVEGSWPADFTATQMKMTLGKLLSTVTRVVVTDADGQSDRMDWVPLRLPPSPAATPSNAPPADGKP